MRHCAGILLSLLLVGSLPESVCAQISPGPLSSSHASLEGNSNCVRCHGLKRESIEERCLECHGGISLLREAGRGFHGREGKGACEDCHPEHAGRDFELVEWPDGSARSFRHERSGWDLEGAHARADCGACHRPEHQDGVAAQREPDGKGRRGQGWVGLETDCIHCHQDPHESRLGTDCRNCHVLEAWRPVTGFDHALSSYPLDGRHVELECGKCHENSRLGARLAGSGKTSPLYRPLPHADCRDCHLDPHRGRFSGACTGCHVTAGFQLAKSGSFDHALTAFPLRGTHQRVKCESCHDEQTAWGKRPPNDRCDRCHVDRHAGQLTKAEGVEPDCNSCHTEASWRESSFDLVRHAQTSFELVGAHARANCAVCHRVAAGETPDPAWGDAAVRLRMDLARCLDCHAASHGAELDAARDCVECHGSEAWHPSSYNASRHADMGWTLEAAHLRASCESCHVPLDPNPASVPEDVEARSRWIFASTGHACLECHVDPHAARYEDRAVWGTGNPCRDCHGMESFVPSTMDPSQHAARGFVLDGAHRAVPCFACHPELGRAGASSTLLRAGVSARRLGFQDQRSKCRDCHDPATLQASGVRP